MTDDLNPRLEALRQANDFLGDNVSVRDRVFVAHWLLTGTVPGGSATGRALPRPEADEDAPKERPDIYSPAQWTRQADGRWRSPKGYVYDESAQAVQRVMAARLRLGLPERPEQTA